MRQAKVPLRSVSSLLSLAFPHNEDGQCENSTADDGNQLKSQRPIYALRDTASPSLCIKLDPLLRELA
jgi:hypothetical protein